jgi:hypothetical protein
MEPLTFGESAQLFQAYRAYGLITTGQTTGTIAVPAGATLLRKMVISVSENATRSVAGVTQFSIGTGADTMFSVGLYFPTSQTSASGAAYSRDMSDSGMAWKIDGGPITWTLSTAFNAGQMDINLYFI